MNRLEINLQTAARHGYLFAIVDRAIYLGAGSDIRYIVSKHKTYSAANKAIRTLLKGRSLDTSADLQVVPTKI